VCRSTLTWLHDADNPGFEHIAQAVNPRARVTPTAEFTWDITIEPDAEPVAVHWAAEMVDGGLTEFDLGERPVSVAAPVRR